MPRGGLGATNLANLGALSATGLLTHTAATAWAARTLTPPASGITVANGGGVAGAPTLALADDLAAIEALDAAGMAARTGTSTWAVRTLTGTSNQVAITDGDGVGGNPTFALPQDIHTEATPTFGGLSLSGSDPVANLSNTDDGDTAITRTMAGQQLSAKEFSAAGLIGPAIKFMSTDEHFTTENPKLLAAIVGRAGQIYNQDRDGSMNLFFAVTGDDPGASSVPTVKMALDKKGGLIVGGDTIAASADLQFVLSTEDLEFHNAGSAAATEQDWIDVQVGGATGYIRVYAAK